MALSQVFSQIKQAFREITPQEHLDTNETLVMRQLIDAQINLEHYRAQVKALNRTLDALRQSREDFGWEGRNAQVQRTA